MTQSPNHSSDPSPGQIALAVMGYLELAVSAILLVLDVAVAAVAFAIAALFLTFVATQVRNQHLDYQRRIGQLPPTEAAPPARREVGPAFWVQLGVGAALIVTSVVFVVLRNYTFAVIFVLWGLTMALFAQRAAQAAGG